jgi:glycerate 2-kinase
MLLLAVGKAAPAMAGPVALQRRWTIEEGLVVAPTLSEALPVPLRWHQSAHPVPDARSVEAGQAALALARRASTARPLAVLLSGGASALMAAPAAGLSLRDKQDVTTQLLRADADITAINCVRKHLSAVKGGRLAAAARGPIVGWLLSDVVTDDPSVIGSGPTVSDPSTYAEAIEVLDRCGGRAAFPRAAVRHLEAGARGDVTETPKPGDGCFSKVETRLIGSRADAIAGARASAEALGYRVVAHDRPVTGEVRVAATRLGEDIRGVAGAAGPICLLWAGETTVEIRGRGKGGRNQELALALAPTLAELDRPAAFASVGTDGVDGPTDAAGAIVNATTIARARQRGLDWMEYLHQNDSWSFFDRLGDLIRTGPTGTNVGDLQVLLIGGPP